MPCAVRVPCLLPCSARGGPALDSGDRLTSLLLQAALALLVVPTPPWVLGCGSCSLSTPVALLAAHEAAVWALFVAVAAILEEALVSVLVLALVLAQQAFASLFSDRVWAQSVAILSAPCVALAALQQTAREARVVLAVAVAQLTRLAGAAH